MLLFRAQEYNQISADEKTIYDTVKNLILTKGADTFLFGSKSKFDELCHEVVTELKKEYPHIKRIYVRAEFPYIDESYRKFILKKYEDTFYPESIMNAGKAAYVERNYTMINMSDYCICYYDEGYLPPRRKKGRKELFEYQPESGTKIAYEYAGKKGLNIYNANSDNVTKY